MNETISKNYELAKQTIIEEGAEGELFITDIDTFKMIGDSVYLVRSVRNELDTPESIKERISPYELWLMTSLVARMTDTNSRN